MRNRAVNLIAGLFSLVLAGVFYVQCGDLEGVGRLYPMWLIGFIALGGAVLLLQSLIVKRAGCETEEDEPVGYRRVGIITAAAVAYVTLITVIGFYPASILFLFLSAVFLSDSGGSPYVAGCLLTLVMCLSVWLVFAVLLGVPTPEGMLF